MASPSLYTTAPSTPKTLEGDSSISVEFGESFSSVPFRWEDKPGHPKPSFSIDDDDDDDFAFSSIYSKLKEEPLKPPPILLGETSFGMNKSAMKCSTWRGRRSYSCDFTFDPFEAAIEKVVEETDVMTPLRGDHNDLGTKWRMKNMLFFPRRSSSDLKGGRVNGGDYSAGSSFSSTASAVSGSCSSPPFKEEQRGVKLAVELEGKGLKRRPYKYNRWIMGCLGCHKGVGVHEFVKKCVVLSS